MELKNLVNIKSLFLDNRTVNQTIFKNTFWLTVGTIINRLLLLVLLIYVARILGATEYGRFTFALSFVSLFIVFSNMGLSQIIIREFSHQEKKKEFYSLISLKILLGLGTFILILIGSFFITSDPLIQKLIWLLGGFAMISGFSSFFYDFFQARQRMEYQALGVVLEALLLLVIGFLVIFNSPSAESLGYGYLVSSVIALTFILLFFNFKVFSLGISWQVKVWKKFLMISWPLALTALFSTFHNYIDSVMMGYLNQITETGWYNASYRIANFTILPMSFIALSFYPALSNFFKKSKGSIQKIWNNQIRLVVVLLVPIVTGGIVLAPRIIDFIYGLEFSPSIFAFQILMLMVGIIFLHYPLHYILIVFNQQKKIFWITLTGATINIILNLILIPKFSLYGAAVATVLTHAIIFFLYYILVSRYSTLRVFDLNFLISAILALIAGGVMYLLISQQFIYNLNIFVSILIGAVIYTIILLVLKKVAKAYGIIRV